jgi:hypothetical protein
MMPKDLSNLPNGITSYGFSEYLSLVDDIIYNGWMDLSLTSGFGLTYGLVVMATATRFFFIPIQLYSQIIGHKMKLLQPDLDEIKSNIKRYSQ